MSFDKWWDGQSRFVANKELTKIPWDAATETAVQICMDMADRYDNDIEGCDGDELLRYEEGFSCALRLAFILAFGRFPPKEGGWGKDWNDLVNRNKLNKFKQKRKEYECTKLSW